MKRPISHFENLENLISFSYSHFGNSLQRFERPLSLNSPLGYCYKYSSNNINTYYVVHSKIGKPHTDRRIVAHEYGHITLGHLNGIYEELDSRLLWTIQNSRADLIKGINESLGIDYADKLLNRVIDDPSLNHSLHNIAMDFEVNQQILSSEDIEEMESDISEVLIESSPEYQILKQIGDEASKNNKDDIKKAIDKKIAESKIKLMLPERYHFKDGTPFPIDLTYPEYLILIIKNLDQFVKMLVSIKNGGSGDTSEVSDQDINDALKGDPNDGSGSSQNQNGGMTSLDDLMNSCGMGSDQENSGDKYKGCREDPTQQQDGKQFDHATESRDSADKSREQGQIKPHSGTGCGDTGGADDTLDANTGPKDAVSEAIDEVIHNFKTKVCSFELKKDMTYLYNRGINRAIIAPVYHTKVKLSSNPKIVFLIDTSGSMDRGLVSRILSSISNKMKNIKKGLKYDIISWSTELNSYYENIDPHKPIPNIRVGGGTRLARGIRFFKDRYDKSSILVLISDFEDYLEEWEKELSTMSGYDIYGFCYGYRACEKKIKNFKIKNFQNDN